MKVFITFSPQQEEGKLHLSHYIPQGNEKLEYSQTRFPIIPVINGYTEPGEEVRVILLVQDYKWCQFNEKYFREEITALFNEKGLKPFKLNEDGEVYDRIDVPYDDAVTSHIKTFQALIDNIRDGDDIHACITYGSKPVPMVEMMAMRYARQIKKDTYISCVVYGQYDREKNMTSLYDETALVHLDDIVRVLAEYGDTNPKRTLDRIIAL
jgi:hypothetical protein